jgi:hypothetical protein
MQSEKMRRAEVKVLVHFVVCGVTYLALEWGKVEV